MMHFNTYHYDNPREFKEAHDRYRAYVAGERTLRQGFASKHFKRNPSNAEFSKMDENFKAACEKAGVEPTKRQASKFRMKSGAAWAARNS